MVRSVIKEEDCLLSPVLLKTVEMPYQSYHEEKESVAIIFPLVDCKVKLTITANGSNDIDRH